MYIGQSIRFNREQVTLRENGKGVAHLMSGITNNTANSDDMPASTLIAVAPDT